jgi:hypothetical protein
MEKLTRHIRLANEIYIISRQVDNLIEQSYKLKCEKNKFVNPQDAKLFDKYLCLGTSPRRQITVYPCLFKYCMEAVAANMEYQHPVIPVRKLYYCVQERIDDGDIEFLELSDELFYTYSDTVIMKNLAERILTVVNVCISMYKRHSTCEHGYITSMRNERNRIKRLLYQ